MGYTLDELKNDITGGATGRSNRRSTTSSPRSRASPSRNSQADDRLTTQMKSVGEVMAIGRTSRSRFQKALRGLEVGVYRPDPTIEPDRGWGPSRTNSPARARSPSVSGILARRSAPA